MAELNLTVNFSHERHLKNFVEMLAWMELCGNVGHCTNFVMVMDGDGYARPKFTINNDQLQEYFNDTRRKYCRNELETIPNVKNVGSVDMCFVID